MTSRTALRHLAHLVLAVPLLAAGLAACEGCRSSGTPAVSNPTGQSGDPGPPTARLYLLSDLAGALEPCGCTKDQLGGLDHFGAWVKHEAGRAPAAVVASAGPLFFMDDAPAGDRADQDRIKADTIARVLRGLGFASFAPGDNDWIDGVPSFDKRAQDSGGTPILTDAKVVVRDVGPLRIGFVGYGQPAPTPSNSGSAPTPSNSGSAPESPKPPVEDVVRRGFEEAKRQGAEAVIALAAVGRGEAKRIADAVPDLTAIVVGSPKSRGDSNTTAPQGEQVGSVLIVQGANHLQSVAVLDLFVREPLQPGQLVKFADATGLELSRKRAELADRIDDLHTKLASWERDPSVAPGDVAARRRELGDLEAQREALDSRPPPAKGSFFRYALREMRESLGQDPSVQADLLAYYKSVDDHNRVAFADRLPRPAGPGEASYVGVDVCTKCHAAARTVWNGTPHSSAYATLSRQFKEFNLECVSCHVTGYEKPGGSTVTHVDKLQDVQCEVCHGPGSKHVTNPSDKTAIVAVPNPTQCLDCHHPPHVEGFDPALKIKEILGPGHGLPVK